MTINNKIVKGWDGLPPLFTNCLEAVFSETKLSPHPYSLTRLSRAGFLRLLGLGQSAQLLHQPHGVPLSPALDDLAIGDAQHVHR